MARKQQWGLSAKENGYVTKLGFSSLREITTSTLFFIKVTFFDFAIEFFHSKQR